MAVETELKLSLSSHAAARLHRHPLLGRVKPARQQLSNCYYDTADLALLKAGVAVRHRRTPRGWLLTVKSARPAAGGLAQRNEWEAASQPDEFDFSHVDDKRLRKYLEKLRPRLQAAFFTDFLRTSWLLEPAPGVRVELALDRGSIRHGDREEILCEIELELVEGRVNALFDIARVLQADFPLQPEMASKAERGYRLFQDTPVRPVHGVPIPLVAGASPLAAFRALAFACVEQLLRNAAGARSGNDPEFVHQARIAVRRLRSALSFWAPFLSPEFVAGYRPAWRAFALRLGNVRNLDVLVGTMLPPLLPHLPAHSADHSWLSSVERLHERARRDARSAFAAPVLGALVLEFSAALHALPEETGAAATASGRPEAGKRIEEVPDAPLSILAGRRLQRLSDRAVRLARKIVDAGTTATNGEGGNPDREADAEGTPGIREIQEIQHQLRILVKRLRYALEFLAPLYAGKTLRRYLSTLAEMQESLGELNDVCHALVILSGHRRSGYPDFARGWFAARAWQINGDLPAVLVRFMKARQPWRRCPGKVRKPGSGKRRVS